MLAQRLRFNLINMYWQSSEFRKKPKFHHRQIPQNRNTKCILLTLFARDAIRVKGRAHCVKAFKEDPAPLSQQSQIYIP